MQCVTAYHEIGLVHESRRALTPYLQLVNLRKHQKSLKTVLTAGKLEKTCICMLKIPL